MKRIVIILSVLLVFMTAMGQVRNNQGNTRGVSAAAPDFAFPEKVEATALKDLDAALKRGDGPATVNAMVRFGLAKGAVSSDSIAGVLARIEKIASDEKNDPVAKSMLMLLQARIYEAIYSNDSYRINRRPTMAGAAVGDYRQWSREDFLTKIKSLTTLALADRRHLLDTPLDTYRGVVTYERSALTFYPTMFDFAANQAIGCLEPFSDYTGVFNPRLALTPMDMAIYPARRAGTVSPDVLDIYRLLIEGRGNSAPAVMARRNQLEYILPRIFSSADGATMGGAWGETYSSSQAYGAYMGAYRQCQDSPYAIELLLALHEGSLTAVEKKELYAITGRFIADNADYFNINAVKNLHEELSRKDVTIDLPGQGAKGIPIKVVLESKNVNKAILKLHNVTKQAAGRKNSFFKMQTTLPAAVQTIEVAFDGEVPFSDRKEVEVTLPDFGLYIVVVTFDGQKKPEQNYPLIACSDLSLGMFAGVGGASAVTVDAVSGAPVDGVSLLFRPWSRDAANETFPGVTENGLLAIHKDKPGVVEPHLGKDIYSPGCNFYNPPERKAHKVLHGEIFTALNLYHLGDKVEFSIVAYESNEGRNTIASGRNLKVVLRDANYQAVDTMVILTDDWGRAESSFTLPSDGLTGDFTINLLDGKQTVTSRRFMVSDYKLPTFAVKVTNVERPAKPGDFARIGGVAETFAGFPVEEAAVRLQLSVRYGSWFWSSTSPVFYEAEVKSDAKGAFSIEIPADVIASSPAPEGYFIASLAVTSAAGETRQATTGFNMGKPLTISLAVPPVFSPEGEHKAMVEVRDYDGKVEDVELAYEIKSICTPLYGGETTYQEVKTGTMHPGDFAAVLSALKGGEYTVRVSAVDPSLAEAAVIDRVIVLDSDKRVCPVNSLLWLPESNVTADDNGVARIAYGTVLDNAHVLLMVSDNEGGMIECRWLSPHKGMNTVEMTLPASDKQVRGYMHVVSRMHSAAASVNVAPASSLREIKIKTETFRDKVTPGSLETLRFKVHGMQGAFPESAVVLDMSNKAIDVLNPNPLNFVAAGFWGHGLNVDGLYFGSVRMSFPGAYRYLNPVSVIAPQFELYGQTFFSDRIMVRGSKMAVTAYGMARNSATTGAVEVFSSMQKTDLAIEAEEAVADVEDEAVLMDNGSLSEGMLKERGDEQVYRPSEMPLAFFRPMLQTDADGNLEVIYAVPDANTTWVLRSLAYNRELLTATDVVQIVASKPVMVSCNAPRFLRTGDRVKLQASVMNAADSAVTANTICEIIDMATGNVVAARQFTDSIGGLGRKVVGVEFEATAGLQGLIYRVKSSAGEFTDGEQVLIPVLPSDQDVVESHMFYLAPDEQSFSMPIEAVGDGRAYLKFTENPAWEVVSALPGLHESQINSSIEAASAIFSAAVAEGLMRDYPEIARTLRKWRDNPQDSALVSQLEKNKELKSILLSATPWVSDALSQTERMQRLVLLLDSRNTSRAIAQGIENLTKTATSGGGWSWTRQYPEVSEWCTARILDMLGDLNRLGWLPVNGKLEKMIDNALAYYDKTVARDFARYPKGDYTSYCYTRLKFPDVKQSTAAAKVTRTTVQRIIAGWKNHSVVQKGVDAIILNGNGYNATARQILESLRQYATVTPEKGMWWQSLENTWFGVMNKVGSTAIILDAFALTDPGNPDIDKIRQWLVLEKSNADWGDAVITSQVVASILTSGRKWTVNPAGTAIRINDMLIEPDREEYATGAFTEQITEMVRNEATLTIDRQGNYPSFGAVVTMRRLPMEAIKAVGCAELKITKTLSVFNGREWVAVTRFKIGDRVKVTLSIEADTDMDYLVIQDHRAASLEPVEQLPLPIWSEGLCFYRENRDTQTNIFIRRLPRGVYLLNYELFATQGGAFSSGTAEAQSQYNPAIAAHSAGGTIIVE